MKKSHVDIIKLQEMNSFGGVVLGGDSCCRPVGEGGSVPAILKWYGEILTYPNRNIFWGTKCYILYFTYVLIIIYLFTYLPIIIHEFFLYLLSDLQ